MTNYKLSGGEKGESLVVVYADDELASVPDSHPRFDEILTLLRTGKADDESVKALVNSLHVAGTKLAALTDRVSITSFGVFFDGDPLRSELAAVLTQLLEENKEDDLTAVAKFLENAAANQTMEGIDAMYRWITNGDLVLTKDGTFLAYKGVYFEGDEITSITSGTAMVDGVVHEGRIPNPIGSVISMPRSEVTALTSVACGPGLHAGTYSYANGFGHGKLILVEINPRDVVSVPSDSSCQKLRVSKYKVIKKIDKRIESPIYTYESDGDFTETGEVDAQVSLKDELEAAFAAPVDSDDEADADDSYVPWLDLDGDDEDEPDTPESTLGIDGHKSKKTKLKKFANWIKGV